MRLENSKRDALLHETVFVAWGCRDKKLCNFITRRGYVWFRRNGGRSNAMIQGHLFTGCSQCMELHATKTTLQFHNSKHRRPCSVKPVPSESYARDLLMQRRRAESNPVQTRRTVQLHNWTWLRQCSAKPTRIKNSQLYVSCGRIFVLFQLPCKTINNTS